MALPVMTCAINEERENRREFLNSHERKTIKKKNHVTTQLEAHFKITFSSYFKTETDRLLFISLVKDACETGLL